MDFSVITAGVGLGFVRGLFGVVVVRRSGFVVEGVTVLPGVVTESDVAVVVVVVVVSVRPSIRFRT